MSDRAFAVIPESSQVVEVEAILNRFEAAWHKGPPPEIGAFLPPRGPLYRAVLDELIKTDLEFRWRASGRQSTGPRLEDYLARFAELGPLPALPLDLIAEEFWVRQRWGDRPGLEEYERRFPGHGKPLRELLGRVRAQLEREFGSAPTVAPSGGHDGPNVVSRPVRVNSQPVATIAGLVEQLATLGLLSASQQEDLRYDLQRRFGAMRPLLNELMARQWLTLFQVNRLLQGRGQELVIGPYVLLERLGEGATGWVFKARHQLLRRLVAIKVLREELLSDTEMLARFYQEVQAVSQMGHPHVIHAYDAGPIGLKHVLVMEYVPGIDLLALCKQEGALPWEQAGDYVCQAAQGMQYIHERGLVHRDIKPSNLLLGKGSLHGTGLGLVKILDLGLARLGRLARRGAAGASPHAGGSGRLTPCHALGVGTPDFMAPEQALDFQRADIRADIYSLGCTWFFLLTGAPPFPGGTAAAKLLRHQHEEPPVLDSLRPDVPSAHCVILGRMLAKDPAQRYQVPAEVSAELARELRRDPRPTEPKPDAVPTARERARNPRVPIADLADAAVASLATRRRRTVGWLSGLLSVAVLFVIGLLVAWLAGVRSRSAPGRSEPSPQTRHAAPTSLFSYSLDHSSGFSSARELTLNGCARIDGQDLVLTTTTDQVASVFTTERVPVADFTTEFTFVLQGIANEMADGITFTVQGTSPRAMGALGGGLGYGPNPSNAGDSARIRRSVAIKFDLYDNEGEGTNSTGVYLDGVTPGAVGSIDLVRTGIDLHSGHVFRVGLTYRSQELRCTITDTQTRAAHTFSRPVDIPSRLGASRAHVGFTAGTGGRSAVQKILSWKIASGSGSRRFP